MTEFDILRAWLLSRRGQWTQIAARVGLSTKTIQRIARSGANPQLSTFNALREEMIRDTAKKAA